MNESEPILPKLPPLGELLKHPTVERVVKRINQTTVAQRAAAFVDELRTSLRKRDVVPTIHHLAERLARKLLGGSQTDYPLINATGLVCGDLSPPLAQPAIDEILQLASEYHEAGSALFERVIDSLCTLTGAEAAWVGHTYPDAVRLGQESAGTAIDAAQYAGLVNPSDWGLTAVGTIRDRLAGGSEVVAIDGAGLLGGPRSGIVVGNRAAVERIAAHSWAESLQADEMTLAALAATLDLYRAGKSVIHEIPVLQLLSAPLENLQQRAERLAQLLTAVEGVASAHAQALESAWLRASDKELRGRSWVIVLKLKNDAPEAVVESWRNATPRLIARTAGDEIHFDLRSVFPRWDQQLVTAVETSGRVK